MKTTDQIAAKAAGQHFDAFAIRPKWSREGWISNLAPIIQAAIDEATVHLRKNLKDLATAANEIRKERDELRAAHASEPDKKDYFPFTPKDWPT